jgi:hypothetical protein
MVFFKECLIFLSVTEITDCPPRLCIGLVFIAITGNFGVDEMETAPAEQAPSDAGVLPAVAARVKAGRRPAA